MTRTQAPESESLLHNASQPNKLLQGFYSIIPMRVHVIHNHLSITNNLKIVIQSTKFFIFLFLFRLISNFNNCYTENISSLALICLIFIPLLMTAWRNWYSNTGVPKWSHGSIYCHLGGFCCYRHTTQCFLPAVLAPPPNTTRDLHEILYPMYSERYHYSIHPIQGISNSIFLILFLWYFAQLLSIISTCWATHSLLNNRWPKAHNTFFSC